MSRARSIVMVAVVTALMGTTVAQERRALVLTSKGESVEGTLVSATPQEVVLLIAGQRITIPTDTVKYISFAGRLDAATTTGASIPAVDKAIAALRTVRAATEIRLLRDQYSAKLLETLPAVREFIKNTDGWFDVKIAMERAVEAYQEPLSTVAAWKGASTQMTIAAGWVEHAEGLLKEPDAASHVEKPGAPLALSFGGTSTGRLGFGDLMMNRELDASSAGGFNDLYTIDVPAKRTVMVTMSCERCRPHLTIADASGKKVEGDAGWNKKSSIQKTLEAGRYIIWAGTFAGEIGSYELSVGR